VVVQASQVVELWYDYNPFGWQHANSWRVVYLQEARLQYLNIYDQDHLKQPFLRWLSQSFPGYVAATFQKLYGHPGGDEPSVLVWSRKAENAIRAEPI
jgi:hypothetical protein